MPRSPWLSAAVACALRHRCSAPCSTTATTCRRPTPRSRVSSDPLREIQWLGAEERTNYPFTLSVEDFGDALGLTAQVIPPLSPERICDYMQQALEQLAHALTHAPDMPVRRLDVMPLAERTLLLQTWNHTEAPYPQQLCVHQLFEQQVERSPEAPALIYEQTLPELPRAQRARPTASPIT